MKTKKNETSENDNINELPKDVQDTFLSFLTDEDKLAASKMNFQWKDMPFEAVRAAEEKNIKELITFVSQNLTGEKFKQDKIKCEALAKDTSIANSKDLSDLIKNSFKIRATLIEKLKKLSDAELVEIIKNTSNVRDLPVEVTKFLDLALIGKNVKNMG